MVAVTGLHRRGRLPKIEANHVTSRAAHTQRLVCWRMVQSLVALQGASDRLSDFRRDPPCSGRVAVILVLVRQPGPRFIEAVGVNATVSQLTRPDELP